MTEGRAFAVADTKGTKKGLNSEMMLMLYATWPNVGDFRPWVYAWCETCEQEKIAPDAIVFAAKRAGRTFRCIDCEDAFECAAIWSPLWRC